MSASFALMLGRHIVAKLHMIELGHRAESGGIVASLCSSYFSLCLLYLLGTNNKQNISLAMAIVFPGFLSLGLKQ